MNQEVDLVAWVDVCPEKALDGTQELRLPGVAVEKDLSLALDRLAPDFAIDATTPDAHYEVTSHCLERKVAVLGEKPLAATLEEARALVDLAEQKATLFVVSQNRRYHGGLVAFKRLVSAQLGGIGHLNAEFYRAPHFGGFRDEMDSPLLLDMAIHTFDAARYVIGSEPVSVYCTEFNPPWSWYRGNASAIAEFSFGNGAIFSYQGSWCAAGFETSWESSWRATGRLGSVVWDGLASPVAEVPVIDDAGSSPFRRVEGPPGEIPGEGIEGSLADFISALRSGTKPMNECHDNLHSFAMVMAALESSRCGLRVPVLG
jgi:predicted dehydrogenase